MSNKWKKRIVGNADVAPGELVSNDYNWRMHPQFQKEALLGAIDDLGFIRSVTVNKRTNRIIDGHLRVALAIETGQETIAVEYVDLSPEEELEALATIDPLAALAEANQEKLADLLQEVNAKSPAVLDLLMKLSEQHGVLDADHQAKNPQLPPERFEIIVECNNEQHQRELFDRLTEEGLSCRVLTF